MQFTPAAALANISSLQGLQVRVYRNLHNGLFSVQHKGKVIAHVESITLSGVTFTVQPAGRAKVLAKKEKFVHAFVNGVVIEHVDLTNWVGYNPYKAATFTTTTGEAIYKAEMATVTGKAILI